MTGLIAETPLDAPWTDEKRNSPFNIGAWVSCMEWASSHAPTLKQFTADTGITLAPPHHAIELMIDQACGIEPGANLRKFIVWATKNIWGENEAPDIAGMIERGENSPV